MAPPVPLLGRPVGHRPAPGDPRCFPVRACRRRRPIGRSRSLVGRRPGSPGTRGPRPGLPVSTPRAGAGGQRKSRDRKGTNRLQGGACKDCPTRGSGRGRRLGRLRGLEPNRGRTEDEKEPRGSSSLSGSLWGPVRPCEASRGCASASWCTSAEVSLPLDSRIVHQNHLIACSFSFRNPVAVGPRGF